MLRWSPDGSLIACASDDASGVVGGVVDPGKMAGGSETITPESKVPPCG